MEDGRRDIDVIHISITASGITVALNDRIRVTCKLLIPGVVRLVKSSLKLLAGIREAVRSHCVPAKSIVTVRVPLHPFLEMRRPGRHCSQRSIGLGAGSETNVVSIDADIRIAGTFLVKVAAGRADPKVLARARRNRRRPVNMVVNMIRCSRERRLAEEDNRHRIGDGLAPTVRI